MSVLPGLGESVVYKMPPDLIERLRENRVVPVLGEDLNAGRGYEHGLPTPGELLEELARSGYPEAVDPLGAASAIPHIAAWYAADRGRQRLCEFLDERFRDPCPEPSEAQKLAVRLAGPAVITLGWGHAVEVALGAATDGGYAKYVQRTDIAYDRGVQPVLIKLCGCITRRESLIITDTDLATAFGETTSELGVAVRPLLLRNTLVFLGIPLDHPVISWIDGYLLRYDKHHPRHVIIHERCPAAWRTIWQDRGYTIIEDDPVSVLRTLVRARESFAPAPPPDGPPPLPSEPYKFLDFYSADDAGIFFGRSDDASRLAAHVLADRLTVLIGSSGVGKTSLLLAGLLPSLRRERCETLVVRALDDPDLEIRRALAKDAGRNAPTSLRVFLEGHFASGKTAAIIVDQFEEFFLRVGPASRAAFVAAIQDCIESDSHDFRFVFAIREDFLHRLLEMEPPLAGIFSNRCWLRRFDENQAREALLKPAEIFGVSVEPSFAERVVRDLSGMDIGGVDPAHLQIVCYQAYRSMGAEKTFDLRLYERLGGASGILANYLEDVLADLETESDRSAARAVLKSMITDERTKAAITVQEITEEAIARQLGLDHEQLEEALRNLQDRRVVRPVAGQLGYFELAHEKLVEKIWEWVQPDDVLFKYIRRALHQVMADWRQFSVLPSGAQWRALVSNRQYLGLHADEAGVMLRIAIQLGDEPSYWIERARSAGVDVWSELEQVVRTFPPEARQHAVHWAAEQECGERHAIMEAAFDGPYPALHRQARRALLRIGGPDAERLLAEHPAPPDFVAIPGGEFVFGTEDPRFANSGPPHLVWVSEYLIQRYPVTNAEYTRFVAATGHAAPRHWQGSQPPVELEDHPVVEVTWHDAMQYAEWYSKVHGSAARLPTAAEWEKAASWDAASGAKRIWAWGDEYDGSKGNTRLGGPGHTTPVGQYSPSGGDSAYGAADMSGNTFDWVLDWWSEKYDVTHLRDPVGPPSGVMKAARGGSWAGSAEGAAAVSHKYAIAPHTANEYVGFRLVISDFVPSSLGASSAGT